MEEKVKLELEQKIVITKNTALVCQQLLESELEKNKISKHLTKTYEKQIKAALSELQDDYQYESIMEALLIKMREGENLL